MKNVFQSFHIDLLSLTDLMHPQLSLEADMNYLWDDDRYVFIGIEFQQFFQPLSEIILEISSGLYGPVFFLFFFF